MLMKLGVFRLEVKRKVWHIDLNFYTCSEREMSGFSCWWLFILPINVLFVDYAMLHTLAQLSLRVYGFSMPHYIWYFPSTNIRHIEHTRRIIHSL